MNTASTFDNTPRGKWIIRKDCGHWVAYRQPRFREIETGTGWRWNALFSPLWRTYREAVTYVILRSSE